MIIAGKLEFCLVSSLLAVPSRALREGICPLKTLLGHPALESPRFSLCPSPSTSLSHLAPHIDPASLHSSSHTHSYSRGHFITLQPSLYVPSMHGLFCFILPFHHHRKILPYISLFPNTLMVLSYLALSYHAQHHLQDHKPHQAHPLHPLHTFSAAPVGFSPSTNSV